MGEYNPLQYVRLVKKQYQRRVDLEVELITMALVPQESTKASLCDGSMYTLSRFLDSLQAYRAYALS